MPSSPPTTSGSGDVSGGCVDRGIVVAPERPDAAEVLALFVAADYAPGVDGESVRLLHTALTHSNVIVAARCGGRLVGIARGWSDFAAICYLADIAVHRDWRRRGVGSALMQAFRREAGGTEVDLLLLSRPAAEDFYHRLGLESAPQARRSPAHAGS